MANQGDDNTRNQGGQAGQNQQGQGGRERDRQQEQAGDTGGQMGGAGDDSDANNPGNFKNDPERASEAGRKGGESSGGGVR